MLKPKRKITRDEIKKDSFVESVFQLRTFIKENRQLLTRIGGGIGLLAFVMIFLSQSFQNNQKEAQYLLTKSTLFLDNGDSQNAKIQLQELVDEYGSTEAGRAGGFYLGQIYFSNNDYESSLPLFQVYSKKGKNTFLVISANEAISNIYLYKNDMKNAIKYQLKAVNHSNTNKLKAYNNLKLIELYLKDSDYDKSNKIIKDLRSNHSDDADIMQKVDYVIGLMMKK
jgi:tetratricopeptide (TPR) repeat protein